MPKPEDALGPNEYDLYCAVRTAAKCLIVEGAFLVVIAGLLPVIFSGKEAGGSRLAIDVLVESIGLLALVGGIAILGCHRRWAFAAYLPAFLNLALFPKGTILGLIILTKMNRYFEAVEAVRNTPEPDDPWKAQDWGSLPTIRKGDR